MEINDSNLIPLLKGEIEGDYQDLIKNKDKVLNLIYVINKDIESLDFKNKRNQSISSLKEKYEDLEKSMKKYSQGLNHINSYYENNKNEKNKNYKEEEDEKIDFDNGEKILISLSKYSNIILNKYNELNKKFELKIKSLDNKNEIKSKSYETRKNIFSNSHFSKDLKRSNSKEKLRMEKREFNQLLEKNKNLVLISNDIKKISEVYSNLLSHSNSNIYSNENNLIENDESQKLVAQTILRNKKYYLIGGGLIIIFIIIIVYIYTKYNTPSNNKNNI
jgi:hypothetical protein